MPWQDSVIKKPFNQESLMELLHQGEKGTLSSHSHWQIVQWCAEYVDYHNSPLTEDPTLQVADEVVVKWELHLASQYSIDDMQRFSQSDVLLPKEYFHSWIEQLSKQ